MHLHGINRLFFSTGPALSPATPLRAACRQGLHACLGADWDCCRSPSDASARWRQRGRWQPSRGWTRLLWSCRPSCSRLTAFPARLLLQGTAQGTALCKLFLQLVRLLHLAVCLDPPSATAADEQLVLAACSQTRFALLKQGAACLRGLPAGGDAQNAPDHAAAQALIQLLLDIWQDLVSLLGCRGPACRAAAAHKPRRRVQGSQIQRGAAGRSAAGRGRRPGCQPNPHKRPHRPAGQCPGGQGRCHQRPRECQGSRPERAPGWQQQC